MTGRRALVWWAFVGLVGASAYLVDLGGLHIPHIGDEAPYVQITRLTAESGRLLPLRAPPGLENTKPPLLFWLGIASTDGGRAFTLLRLRLPIVLFTFLTGVLVFAVTRRLAGAPGPAFVAALSFLAFWTTFQYGRPFLTNPPETFFVFLPFGAALMDARRLDRWGFWVLAGLSVGVAALFKSFALVVPVAFAFLLWALARRKGRVRDVLRLDVPKGALALVLALACFALWPLLDPDPQSILAHFVWKENVGKIGGGGYLRGLLSGRHGVWTTLLGP
ncbi:MAG: ArnT family glycosyltransferase, partial [Planctomycetota bacterium]